jgi:hypothetical protein
VGAPLRGFDWNLEFVRSPGVEADGFSQASSADKASCWENVVVASDGKPVC